MRNPIATKKLTNLAFNVIEYFPLFLGPFPFSELNIIEKNELGYGQAPAGTMFITREAFTPLAEEANEYSKGINARFAHEIAHQYWGTVVRMPSPEEQWITEAFAEYSAALFMRAGKGRGAYSNMVSTWRSDALRSTDKAPIPLANRLSNQGDPLGRDITRFGLLYGKGPILLAALHKELGEEQFLTFLKSYQRSFRWKFGTTQSLAGLLQFMTKKDYTPFFEQYYWGTAMPDMK